MRLSRKIEKQTIYFTAVAIILSGFLRLTGFKYSNYVFNLALLPYIVVRGAYYLSIFIKKNKKIATPERYRLYVYIAVFTTILLSVLDFFSADFFVIFLVMVDFLLLQEESRNLE